MIDPLRELKNKIGTYKEDLATHLLSGGARSHEEYCRAVGRAAALELILSDIASIEKKYIED